MGNNDKHPGGHGDAADPAPKPLSPELSVLVQRLVDLRNALEETALALSDFQCALDSDDSRAAARLVTEAIERAKLPDYSAGDGV